MQERGDNHSYSADGYRLAIVERRNGTFRLYADLDGLRYLQCQVVEAFEYLGYDHGDIHTNGDRHFKVGAPKRDYIRLWIEHHPSKSPRPQLPTVERLPGRGLEINITLEDTEHLFVTLGRMADRAAKSKGVERQELPYGISVEYKGEWETA